MREKSKRKWETAAAACSQHEDRLSKLVFVSINKYLFEEDSAMVLILSRNKLINRFQQNKMKN